MSNSKVCAEQAATNSGNSQCNENVYKLPNGSLVCLNSNDEKGKEEARKHAHQNRNQFQQCVCPINLSQFEGQIGDASTGVIWTSAGFLERFISGLQDYHQTEWEETTPYLDNNERGYSEYQRKVRGGEKCYRGTLPPKEEEALKQKCEFRQSARALGVNPNDLRPGFQCCYYPEGHPQAGQLSPSSTFDFNTPQNDNLTKDKHRKYDVKPGDDYEKQGLGYENYDMSSGKDINPMNEKDMEKQSEE